MSFLDDCFGSRGRGPPPPLTPQQQRFVDRFDRALRDAEAENMTEDELAVYAITGILPARMRGGDRD